MLFKATAVVGFLAATVAADGASIVAALSTISSATVTLNNSVNSWDGSLFGALPIAGNALALINDINQGTSVANASAPLNTTEAVNVYTATNNLAKVVNSTLINIDNAYPKAKKAFVAPIFLYNIEQSKNATDKLVPAIISKVPANLQSFAETVAAQFDADFEVVIATYSQ